MNSQYINQLPSTSRGCEPAQPPPIERTPLESICQGLVVMNSDGILAGTRLPLKAHGRCRGYIRCQNSLTMEDQAQLAMKQAAEGATYRVYNITNYDAALS